MIQELIVAGLFAISGATNSVADSGYLYENNAHFEYYTILTASASDNMSDEGLLQASVRLDFTLSYENQYNYELYIDSVFINTRSYGDAVSYTVPRYVFTSPFNLHVHDNQYFNISLEALWDDGIDYALALRVDENSFYRTVAGSMSLGGYYTAYSYTVRYTMVDITKVIGDYLNGIYGVGGYQAGYDVGYLTGYSAGYNEGAFSSSDLNIATLIYSIFNAPVAILGECLNFTIFGINLKNLAYFMLTTGIVVWIYSVFKKG